MLRRLVALLIFGLALIPLTVITKTMTVKSKPEPKVIEASSAKVKAFKMSNMSERFATAVACTARYDDGTAYFYGGFVYGDEAYATYIDPAKTCPSPYPYTINGVLFQVHYGQAPVTDTIGANILLVDNSDPACPKPGAAIAVSSAYEIPITDTGLWAISIDLDTPIVVNDPYFAGFYIYDLVDSITSADVGPHLTTDYIANAPDRYCYSYNLYDTTIGWEDIANYGFLGRLVIYTDGISGGSNPNPAPQAEILDPMPGILYEPFTLWARDSAYSDSVVLVEFSYAPTSTGVPTTIGSLTSADLSLRDGINSPMAGHSYSFDWDPTGLASTNYWIMVTMTDSQGRVSADTVQCFVMPTAPAAYFNTPSNATDFCDTLGLTMSSPSPSLTRMKLFAHRAMLSYDLGMTTLSQSSVGDANQNPGDGNYVANGEYGEYYSGPVAAATALKVWSDRGLTPLMQDTTGASISEAEATELLATHFRTRQMLGTTDEDMLNGIKDYAAERAVQLDLKAIHDPDYYDIRNYAEGRQQVVVLGAGGTPAVWLAVDGFEQWQQPDGSYFMRVADPVNGTVRNIPIRNTAGGCEIQIYSSWQPVDIMIAISSSVWAVAVTEIGQDSVNADGWQFDWTPAADSLTAGSPYFVAVEGTSPAVYGQDMRLYRYSCSSIFAKGDYNGDGVADINDFFILQNYIATGTAPPIGDAFRADANGDNNVNLADLVYYMRYLFGSNSEPVY